MNESKINVRYAKALFSLCKELDQVEQLQRDVSLVDKLCRESADFMQLLENPVISVSRKKTVVQKILEPHVGELGMRFFMLIIEKQRETEIPGICRNFLDMVRADRGIIPAQVTTAGKLSAETLAVIRDNIESETGKSVELNDRVNPELIGGMIIRIGDRQYDGSVSTQLKKMKSALMGK